MKEKTTISNLIYYKLMSEGVHLGASRTLPTWHYSVFRRTKTQSFNTSAADKKKQARIHFISLEASRTRILRAATALKKQKAATLFLKGHQASLLEKQDFKSCSVHLIKKWKQGCISNVRGEKKVVQKMALVPLLGKDTYSIRNDCFKYHIPTYGIYDSDLNYKKAVYAIPSSDNTVESIGLVSFCLFQ